VMSVGIPNREGEDGVEDLDWKSNGDVVGI
jgi:hypothetical protein